MSPTRLAAMLVAVLAAVALPIPREQLAQAAPPADPGKRCELWEVDYRLGSGTAVTIVGTPMGAGDGQFPVGPGWLRLRWEDEGGQPGRRAALVNYELPSTLVISASAVLASLTVTTRTRSWVTPPGPHAARGRRDGNVLRWEGPVQGYQARGTVFCEGALCGQFGAPREGQSPYRQPPHPVDFRPFQFSGGGKSFTMEPILIDRDRHSSRALYLRLAGQETARKRIDGSCF